MEYLYTELMVYLLFYGFLGWIAEVVVVAVTRHKFSNRGFFNLPICPKYGVMADILLLVLPTVGEELSVRNVLLQAFITLIVVSAVDVITTETSRRMLHRNFQHYERETLFSGEFKGGIVAVVKAAMVIIVIKLFHPFVFAVVRMIPLLVLKVIGFTVLAFMAVDMISVIYAGAKRRRTDRRSDEAFHRAMDAIIIGRRAAKKAGEEYTGPDAQDKVREAVSAAISGKVEGETAEAILAEATGKESDKIDLAALQERIARTVAEENLGNRICNLIWKRLERAYPGITERKESAETEKYVFAKGLCLNKLIWVFIIWAFVGDLFETVFVWAKTGVWMSRTSVIYGTFSIVWGFGAVIIAIVTQKLAEKDDRYIFVAGSVLWGVYEYTCSVISEVVFGRTFWDYSDMMFNFGGRTNLMYCMFGGILSVLWIKILYPPLSNAIEKIPVAIGMVATWTLVALMAADILLSGAALSRYVSRQEGEEAQNALEEFIDQNYSDEYLESIWPNMRVPGSDSATWEESTE